MDFYSSYNTFISMVQTLESNEKYDLLEDIETFTESELDDILGKLKRKLHTSSGREREIILKNIQAIEKSVSKKSSKIQRNDYDIFTSYGGDKNITPDVFINKMKNKDFPFKIVYTFIYFPHNNKIIGEYGDRYLHDSLIKNRIDDISLIDDFDKKVQGNFETTRKGDLIPVDFHYNIMSNLDGNDIIVGRVGNNKVSIWQRDSSIKVLDKFMKKLQDVVSKVDLDELYIPDKTIR